MAINLYQQFSIADRGWQHFGIPLFKAVLSSFLKKLVVEKSEKSK